MSLKHAPSGFTFIHIPKTGGSSVESLIGGDGHASVHDLFGNQSPVRKVFTIIRNPFDRIVSAFHHNIRWSDWPVQFEDWNEFLRGLPAYLWVIHLRPQYSFLINRQGLQADTILRFEHLEQEWNRFAKQHGLPRELPHKRQTLNRCPMEAYFEHEWQRLRVCRVYERDFHEFDYSFHVPKIH